VKGVAEGIAKSKETVMGIQRNNCAPDDCRPIRAQIAITRRLAIGHQNETNKPTGGRLESNQPAGREVQ